MSEGRSTVWQAGEARGGEMVRCPRCGQVLFAHGRPEGSVDIVIMCRRCRHYMHVRISGGMPGSP